MTDAAVEPVGNPSSVDSNAPVSATTGAEPVVTETAEPNPAGSEAPGPDAPAVAATGDGSGPPPVQNFSVALVSAVTVDLPSQHPTVLLREMESPRRQLSFSIGLQDGVVLSHAVRRITTPRPLTPELMSSVLQGFDIDIVAVRIVGRQGGIYFAELDLRGRSGRSVHSCRPSDGLTLALLQPVQAPILIDRRLLETSEDVLPG